MVNELTWIKPSVELLEALSSGNLSAANALTGTALDPILVDDSVAWLWRLRLEQTYQEATTLAWIAQLVLLNGQVVGHAGFHGPPDEWGTVEVAYYVLPAYRGRGLAKEMLRQLLQRAQLDATVSTVRASVSPENRASLAVVQSFAFVQVGEQWDEIDGLELVFTFDASMNAIP